MAKEPKQANAPKIEFDDLTNKLVPDPATIPDDSVALAGFVGRSAEEGNIRLYVDASFRNYYEISISDVLYNQQLPTTQSPLGGSVVYVKGGAPLRRVQVSAEIEAGSYRARCRVSAPGRPVRLLELVRIGLSMDCMQLSYAPFQLS
jgi:hypothetical protein